MAVKTYKVVEQLKPVSTLDLPAETIEAIEDETGVPFNLWGSKGSTMKVLRHVLAAGNDTDPDALKGKSLRELQKLVTLDEEDEEGNDPDR
jgi:hypothetical protein